MTLWPVSWGDQAVPFGRPPWKHLQSVVVGNHLAQCEVPCQKLLVDLCERSDWKPIFWLSNQRNTYSESCQIWVSPACIDGYDVQLAASLSNCQLRIVVQLKNDRSSCHIPDKMIEKVLKTGIAGNLSPSLLLHVCESLLPVVCWGWHGPAMGQSKRGDRSWQDHEGWLECTKQKDQASSQHSQARGRKDNNQHTWHNFALCPPADQHQTVQNLVWTGKDANLAGGRDGDGLRRCKLDITLWTTYNEMY